MKLIYKDVNIEVVLSLNDSVTMIAGDSATGKTYLFNYLKDIIPMYAREGIDKSVAFCNCDLSMFRFYTTGDGDRLLRDLLSGNNYIYFIDRGEIFLTPEMVSLMNKGIGSFVCFSRHIPGLYFRPSSYTKLYFELKNNIKSFTNIKKVCEVKNSVYMTPDELKRYWGMIK